MDLFAKIDLISGTTICGERESHREQRVWAIGRRNFKPERINHMLHGVEIKVAGGKTAGEVCGRLGILEPLPDS